MRVWLEGNPVARRPTPQFRRHVVSLDWNRHRGCIACRLEHRAKQNRGVGYCRAATFSEPFDLEAREVV
jgi:hypothetical protein